MYKRHRKSGIKIGLLYQLLSLIVPKPVAVTIIAGILIIPALFVLIPLIQTTFIIFLKKCPSDLNILITNITTNITTVEKQLNNAANIASIKPYFYTFNSNGLANYFQNGIKKSQVYGNKLTTYFARIEFEGDGSCISCGKCTATFNNYKGKYTIYLKNNGEELIETCGYSLSK